MYLYLFFIISTCNIQHVYIYGFFLELYVYIYGLLPEIKYLLLLSYNDNAKIICDLVEMKDCNSDAVLNKEECNAVSSYLSTV